MLALMPLETIKRRELDKNKTRDLLTAYVGAGSKAFKHLWIHGYHHFLLALHEPVAIFHLFGNPVAKRLADHSCADVNDPLLRDLLEVRHVWQVLSDIGLLAGEVADLRNCQIFILWHVDGLDIIALDMLFLHGDQVLKEVDGHIVDVWQVY